MAVYKKVKMRANNIIPFKYNFNIPSSMPIVVTNNAILDIVPALNSTTPQNGISNNPNKLENMFDDSFDTSFRLAPTWDPTDGVPPADNYNFENQINFTQFTYDFGRPIKPRKFRIATSVSRPVNVALWWLSDLGNPNVAGYNAPEGTSNVLGYGEVGFTGGPHPYYTNIVYHDQANQDFGSPDNMFVMAGVDDYWQEGGNPSGPPLQPVYTTDSDGNSIIDESSAYFTTSLIDPQGSREFNLCTHTKGFGGFDHITKPLKKGFYDGYQYMMVLLIPSDGNIIQPALSIGSEVVNIELWEEVVETEYNVEFDDALLGLNGWRNPRYNGSKLTSRRINKYTPSSSKIIMEGTFDSSDESLELEDKFIASTNPGLAPDGGFLDNNVVPGMQLKNVSTGEMALIKDVINNTEIITNSGFNLKFNNIDAALNNGDSTEGSKFQVVDLGNPIAYPDWKGDVTLGKNPVIENSTTALYIANTVVGGKEDQQFATIKNHSYVGINKILIINKEDRTVQILDKEAEGFEEFNRFITKDFPAGSSANVKVIDESVSNNLKSEYFVKMNKGYLLKSFNYKFNGQTEPDENGINGLGQTTDEVVQKNTMFLYKRAHRTFNLQSSVGLSPNDNANLPGENFHLFGVDNETINAAVDFGFGAANEELCFQFAALISNEDVYTCEECSLDNPDDLLPNIGPVFNSSSIIENIYTSQFHTRRFGFLTDEVEQGNEPTFVDTVYGQTVEFLCSSSLNFAIENDLELYCTFLEGDKDFAPGTNDERSISTFQIDPQRTLDKLRFSTAEPILPGANTIPKINELTFKGKRDPRFLPTINAFFNLSYSQYYSMGWVDPNLDGFSPFERCAVGEQNAFNSDGDSTGGTVVVDEVYPIVASLYGTFIFNPFSPEENDISGSCYLMAGNNGQNYIQDDPLTNDQQNIMNFTRASFTADNFYSGSIEAKYGKTGCEAFQYDISFLDKDHTLIMDIDKPTELFDGIGEKGLVIIPEFLDGDIRRNVEYYLQKAGIVESTTSIISPDTPNL